MRRGSVVVGARKGFAPMLTLLLGMSSCLPGICVVESVAAASEWPLGLPEEYTMAVINITLKSRNGSAIQEKSQMTAYHIISLLSEMDHDEYVYYLSENGRFGKGGKIQSVSGVVIHVRSALNGSLNNYACDPIVSAVPTEPWIALVKRGKCDYDQKLENVFGKNAVAMVVYDREESETLEEMKLNLYSIPGVFIYKSRGERLINLTDAGFRLEMHIGVGEVCSKPYSGLNRTTNGRHNLHDWDGVDGVECVDKNTSVLFVSISFIVLMVISLAWLVFYYIQRFRYLHAKDRLAQRLCNAAKKALAKIPTRSLKLNDEETVGESECCAVCIEFYRPGDTLRTLPCRHEFHKQCVDPWLLEHRTCPMCKMDILKHYGYIFTGSQESILHLDPEDGTTSSESRDTDSSTNEEAGQIQTHQEHHRIHHHPADTLSVSSPMDDTFSTIPEEEPLDCEIYDDAVRRPSLLSLTVTVTPNGGVSTTASSTPDCTSASSDYLISSRSLTKSCGGLSTVAFASPHDSSTVVTSLVSSHEYPQLAHPIMPCLPNSPANKSTTPGESDGGEGTSPDSEDSTPSATYTTAPLSTPLAEENIQPKD